MHLVLSLQNIGLELQYKTCYARVLDSKRKFLQAATQYYELSQVENVRGGQVNLLLLRILCCCCCVHSRSLQNWWTLLSVAA